MTFVFKGIPIKKNLSEEVRNKLVYDKFVKKDPKTKRDCVYARVTYYDEKRKFNVYVASRKLGEKDPETGQINAIMRRKSPQRTELSSMISNLIIPAETALTDDRDQSKVVYPLPLVLDVMLLSAVSGHSSSRQIASYFENNKDELKKRWGVEWPATTPSFATINRLMQIINPDELQGLYQQFVFPFLPDPLANPDQKDIVSIDGQVVRASRHAAGRPHQYLSFYSTCAGGAFCQIRIDAKSNEKPAALMLANKLDLHGTIVTADAMHCDRKLLETLMAVARADYCVALKANQGNTAKAVKALFEQHPHIPCITSTEKAHGRHEVRTTYVLPGNLLDRKILGKWYGLEAGCIASCKLDSEPLRTVRESRKRLP